LGLKDRLCHIEAFSALLTFERKSSASELSAIVSTQSVKPVGAIGKDGQFDFVSCSTHNYREFMGGRAT
jgi:hypothetical protein